MRPRGRPRRDCVVYRRDCDVAISRRRELRLRRCSRAPDRGFDVLSVAEVSVGADDERVIAIALDERRILLTEDKDFGQLVFATGSKSLGVVLIRFPASA